MINDKKYHNLLFKLLSYLVIFFPLIILFRSATINATTLILSILFVIYGYAAKIKVNSITNNYSFIYLFFFFLFILINSIFHNHLLLLIFLL